MGTHFRLRTGTTCGVNGKRKFHERISAISKGVVFTCFNPRELKGSKIDKKLTQSIKTTGGLELVKGWPKLYGNNLSTSSKCNLC